ncbi:hypothetical protein HZS80_01805 [Halomonas glaciei]|uniref:Uncharacterized protein n=1 Tax=Vreelandella glaciei TaxID=186761 RepID=A0A7Z0RWT4_9GAMM|nr:hypothetical protein [Halomonas glaciei]
MGFVYTLFERLRTYLKKSSFERMSQYNLRLKLIKVGRRINEGRRKVRLKDGKWLKK